MISINLLPKNLRRVREPGYWRLLAVLFPLLVFGVAFVFQFLANQTAANLQRDVVARTDQLALLQPFLREQEQLRARQRELNNLIAVRDTVRENRMVWTGEIVALLETLPAQGSAPRPRIDFRSLNMRALGGAQSDEARYEGAPVVAEMTIAGNVMDLDTLAEFVHTLERSTDFGVSFQNAAQQEDTDTYSYNLSVGAIAEDAR